MTNKSTKRALILSILSIAVCLTMLIGSTFAWFTDTATTGVNKIQAGTLDVDLVDANGDTLVGKTLDFKKASGAENQVILWEPGCTYELQEVFVKNNGNLALKYQIVITGINGDAKLNEAIDWEITDGDFSAKLEAGNTSNAIKIKGHMKESAGNEYQGLSIDGISITVLATQVPHESDSFTNEYDANAPTLVMIGNTKYDTLADAITAAKNNDTIKLAGNFTLPNISNKVLTFKAADDDNTPVITITKGNNATGSTLTFDGVTVVTPVTHDYVGITHVTKVVYKNSTIKGSQTVYAPTVEFENCEFVNYKDYNVWTYGASNATFKNCNFTTGGKAVLVYTEATHTASLSFTECTFNSNGQLATDKAAIEIGESANGNKATYTVNIISCTANGFAMNKSNSTLWGNKNNMPADRLNVIIDNQPQTVTSYVVIKDAAGLVAFEKEVNGGDNYSGKTVILANNIDLKNVKWTPIGQTGATQFLGTFDGNGKTISNLKINTTAQSGTNYSTGLFGWLNAGIVKNLTIDGADIKANKRAGAIAGYLELGATVDNCTVKNAKIDVAHIGEEDDNNTCGDKAGAVIGFMNSDCAVKNCKAIDCAITAGRDAGQVVGAGYTTKVTNCTATNVTVASNSNVCKGGNINTNVIGRILGD